MDLLLNLGHNSAAIGITPEGVIGYEQERLTRQKSSSAFPREAIDEILRQTKMSASQIDRIFISHWFDDYEFLERRNPAAAKYCDYDFIDNTGAEVTLLSSQFTHHDCHAWSAVSFFENHHPNLDEIRGQPFHVVVTDGFGNGQEVTSVYKLDFGYDNVPDLVLAHRCYGYPHSLGLMYQYATAFCGMKMHQDEYKFLGYESHIGFLEGGNVSALADFAHRQAKHMFNQFRTRTQPYAPSTNHIDTDDLKQAQTHFNDVFSEALRQFGNSHLTDRDKRVAIGYFIQTVLEEFYVLLLQHFNVQNVLVAGGVHYNVKLNNRILNTVPGLFSVVPLAGDQGVGIGLYVGMGNKFPFKSLLWGKRKLSLTAEQQKIEGVHYVTDRYTYTKLVAGLVRQGQLVNTVTGAMEFGPRALCNTSTLAIPYDDHVDMINSLNGRDTVMPFAGVMLEENLSKFHPASQYERCIGSHHYMITTFDYLPKWNSNSTYTGIMHAYPSQRLYSGRPQVVQKDSDQPIATILSELKGELDAVINTSLNVHGVPIVFNATDAVNDFLYNVDMAKKLNMKRPVLVVGDF